MTEQTMPNAKQMTTVTRSYAKRVQPTDETAQSIVTGWFDANYETLMDFAIHRANRQLDYRKKSDKPNRAIYWSFRLPFTGSNNFKPDFVGLDLPYMKQEFNSDDITSGFYASKLFAEFKKLGYIPSLQFANNSHNAWVNNSFAIILRYSR